MKRNLAWGWRKEERHPPHLKNLSQFSYARLESLFTGYCRVIRQIIAQIKRRGCHPMHPHNKFIILFFIFNHNQYLRQPTWSKVWTSTQSHVTLFKKLVNCNKEQRSQNYTCKQLVTVETLMINTSKACH